MTLAEHLQELRYRFFVMTISVTVFAILAFLFYSDLLKVLQHPYCAAVPGHCKFLATNPLDGLTLRVKIAFFGGFLLSTPVILWQTWRFVTPGLKTREKRYIVPFVSASLLFFTAGRCRRLLQLRTRDPLPQVHRRIDAHYGVQPQPVPLAVLVDDVHLRSHVPLPGRAGRLGAGERRHADPAAARVALRRDRDHDRRRRVHPERGPAVDVRPRGAPDPLLLPRHRYRQAAQTVSDTDYRHRFIDGLGFGLDPFQVEALEAVDRGVNVLVSAPTGSGKT